MNQRTRAGLGFRSIIRPLLAVVIGAGLLSAVLTTSPASAATTGGTVVYTAQLNIPAPPSSNFAGSAGGDGWALAFTNEAVYNVFHHQETLQVACHLQTNATPCWSPKTITDGSGHDFATAAHPGLWLDQTTGHLFVYATRSSDGTAGVVCIDTTQPASNANPFCGFTALTTVGGSPIADGISGVSNPLVIGTNWYAFNAVDGLQTGDQNRLMCFSLTTFSACPAQPFAVNLGSSVTVDDQPEPNPSIASFGTQVVIPIVLSTGEELACFDTSTSGNCAGTWPVSSTNIAYPGGAGGAPFPILNSTGTPTGFCIPITGVPCYSLSGSSVATPSGMTTAVPGSTSGWNGPALTIGARAYIPDGVANRVDCYDYTANASCSGFPKVLSNLELLYTVNPDPQRPTCIWVNSDGGTDQIQNFDAYTGGPCGQGPVRVLAASIVAPNNVCIPSNYTSLQVTVPARSQYTSGSVQFEDFNGDPIPGQPAEPLDNTGSVNLTPLNLTTASPLPQFLITLNGAGSPPEVDVTLTWVGVYSPECTTGGQSVSGGFGYRLGASDGGVFDFGQSAFYGSMTGKHLNGPEVGIASTPDGAGYWLAASDGGVFAFGDAQYYGGLGASLHLNAPIVGIAATPTGKGYWLVAADGGVFAYGDAAFEGSLGAGGATAKVVGITATPSGKGYWLVSADGNVYPMGDAVTYGSMYGKYLHGPVVGIAATPSGKGYWLVASDGGVFAYGDAPFAGSMFGKYLDGPMVGIQPTPSGNGYWLDAVDGGVFAFGDAPFLGCMVGSPLNAPMDSIGA